MEQGEEILQGQELRSRRIKLPSGFPCCLLAHIHAAVGVDGLAGDEGTLGEEDRDAADFFGGADGADGDAGSYLFWEGGDHVGFDEGGGDGVGGDAFLGELGGVGGGEAKDAGFGGGVVRG